MIKLVINTANAAFRDEVKGFEVARIIQEAADKMENGQFDIKLYDINGNVVGSCAETDKPFKLEPGENYITLEMDTDNAAFEGNGKDFECARVLREASAKIRDGEMSFKLRDVNGNTVGKVEEVDGVELKPTGIVGSGGADVRPDAHSLLVAEKAAGPGLYEELKAAGILLDHHESDLYFPVNAQTKEILARYPLSKSNSSVFKSETNGQQTFDVPFAYVPAWEKKLAAPVSKSVASDTDDMQKPQLEKLLISSNRVIYDRLPFRPQDGLDKFVFQTLITLASANRGSGFEAIQAGLKLEKMRDMSYVELRAAAALSPDYQQEATHYTIEDMRPDIKGKLLQMNAVSLDDEELHRVFDEVVLPDFCIREAQNARKAGVTMDDIRLENFQQVADMASKVAEKYGVKIDAQEITDLLVRGGGPVIGEFEGKVVAVEERLGLVFQSKGRGEGRALLIDSLSRVPEVGEMMKVSFRDGKGLVADRDPGKDLGR